MDKKRSLILGMILALLLVIVGIVFVLQNNTAKQYDPEENMISGGPDSHWFRTDGVIQELDIDKKLITVSVDQNNEFFDSESIDLDCSKFNLHIESFEKGQKITFYFFTSNITDSNVKVEEIELTKDS